MVVSLSLAVVPGGPVRMSWQEVMRFAPLVNRFDKLNSICWSVGIGSGEEERPGLMDKAAPIANDGPGMSIH